MSYINYDSIVQASLLRSVRYILSKVEKEGLDGGHHFYVSFATDRADVEIPAYLRERHPHEVTIVLQHQFWDLKVYQDYFAVTLSFNNNLESIKIPFSALLSFVDPSVKFGLQFSAGGDPNSFDAAEFESSQLGVGKKPLASNQPKGEVSDMQPTNVVTLDSFRKSSK